MTHSDAGRAQSCTGAFAELWNGSPLSETPLRLTNCRIPLAAPPPARERSRHGWLLSCCLHLCLLGGLAAFAALDPPREELLCRIMLVSGNHGGRIGTQAAQAGISDALQTLSGGAFAASERAARTFQASEKTASIIKEKKTAAEKHTAPRRTAIAKARPLQKIVGKNGKVEAVRKPYAHATAGFGSEAASTDGSAATGAAQKRAGVGGDDASFGQGPYMPGQLDDLPSVLRAVRPNYPPEAKKKKIEGRVVVRLIVDSAGLSADCAVHAAEPNGYFEEAALAAARKTRFIPGKKNGRPVRSLVLLPFDFRLR